jgi:uncharacterized protein
MQIRKVLTLMIAGAMGTPIGIFVLKIIVEKDIKILTGIVLILFSALLLLGYRKSVNNEKLALASIGLISGILNGSTAMSGPPVILFYNNQEVEKTRFRSNLVLYFLFLNILAIPVLVLNNMLTEQVLSYTLFFIPSTLIGVTLGIILSKKINENIFKKMTLLIVLISGMIALILGLK